MPGTAFNSLLLDLKTLVEQLAQAHALEVEELHTAGRRGLRPGRSSISSRLSTRGSQRVQWISESSDRHAAELEAMEQEANGSWIPTDVRDIRDMSDINIEMRDGEKSPEGSGAIQTQISKRKSLEIRTVSDGTPSWGLGAISGEPVDFYLESVDLANGGSVLSRNSGFHRVTFLVNSPWADYREFDHVLLADVVVRRRLEKEKGKRSAALATIRNELPRVSRTMTTHFGEGWKKFMVIHPESLLHVFWVLVAMSFLMYDFISVPLFVCFDLQRTQLTRIVDLSGVIFWTLDIVSNFVTGIHTKTHLELRPQRIARMYVRKWLLLDISLVTLEWVNYWNDAFDGEWVGFFRGLRLRKIVRSLRLARLMRAARFRPALRPMIHKFRVSTACLRVVRGWSGLLLANLLGAHWLACVWYAVGSELDNGWVHANGLELASTSRVYILSVHWSVSRLHGIMTDMRLETSTEKLADLLLIYVSIILVCIYIARVSAAIMVRAIPTNMSLWKYGMAYTRRYNISQDTEKMLHFYLEASHWGGVYEIQSRENRLLQSLPVSLSHDLIFEARSEFMMAKAFFKDMQLLNERVVRRVSTWAMSSQAAVRSEAVFSYGDACDAARFVILGAFAYASLQSTPIFDHMLTSDTEESNRICGKTKMLQRGAMVSQNVLWTAWEHSGSLLAVEEATLLCLDSAKFADVIVQHKGRCLLYAVKYAKHFVWHLNHDEIEVDDMTEFPDLNLDHLDDRLFEGTSENHFIFISHYKLEAGTEATLIRDSLESMLTEVPSHPANNLLSPIFIDSEDLADLGKLQHHVTKSSALVLLLSPGVLTRPWCLVEIVTAIRNSVNIVPVDVQRPGMTNEYPDDDFYRRLLAGQLLSEDQQALIEQEGVGLADAVQAIRQVFLKIALPFSPQKSKSVREAELNDILKRCGDMSRASM